MILLIDVGNSNTVVGVHTNDILARNWRLKTDPDRTEDELGILIKTLFHEAGYRTTEVEGIAISSVVPSLIRTMERMCEVYFNQKPFVVGPGIKTGLNIQLENPREVGVDRIVTAVAGIAKYGYPLIIVDVGTATNFSVINEKGHYLGGPIAPGIGISAEALFHRAAKLPRVEVTTVSSVLGRNTTTSIQAGIYYGAIGQVEGIIAQIKAEVQLPFRVVATGGFASLLAEGSKSVDIVDPLLTLSGLHLIWKRNQK